MRERACLARDSAMLVTVAEFRPPRGDEVPPSPVDWQDIPLGVGQEDLPLRHLQFTHEGDDLKRTNIRRKPGYEHHHIIHRPERPV